jgi:FkbM family methyltransferase
MLSQIADFILPLVFDEWSMVVEGPYELKKCSLSVGDIVLDCGANMGVFSAYASYKGCDVYAFEPTVELLPIIQKHSEMNGGRITVVNAAVADISGRVGFIRNSYSCGGNAISKDANISSDETVESISIDEFVGKHQLQRVDFIKADIEGAERLMLKGAHDTLKKFAPKLAVCTYHMPDDKEVLERLILAANPRYRIAHKWQKLFAWVE